MVRFFSFDPGISGAGRRAKFRARGSSGNRPDRGGVRR